MLQAFLAGLALGGGLIVAIGPQNAFVIRQGILNSYVFWMCLLCSVSDAILIWGGTFGLGTLLALLPQLLTVMRYGGALFLLWYGIKALLRALHPHALEESPEKVRSLASALALCAAFTWLNPHVYLDTVVLAGSIANARPAGEQAPFALGASLASFIWFFAIGYGAKALRQPLSQPSVWRGIDFAIAAIMFWLAVKLLIGG
ncbi:LysE/ArgO family amino acid transporter [Aestuariivirga litoralis]|uniref:LysE/ArgO family amino acid transporter n=1 Tax=Aestuariivirga litoralis TaxID=2650924 RepID=UPI0018C48B0B|nr:LysE family transporter [Aestuariivirga litoralis]MBG1233669.1 amino acid transporter [Aestuariivirga litoralis]